MDRKEGATDEETMVCVADVSPGATAVVNAGGADIGGEDLTSACSVQDTWDEAVVPTVGSGESRGSEWSA